MREYPGNQESEELATADIPAANKEANAISQKLVKTASTRFQVADINKSLNEILRIVAKYPGYVADSRMASSTSRTEHRLSVRIPHPILIGFFQISTVNQSLQNSATS